MLTVPDVSRSLQGGDLVGVAVALANAAAYAVYIAPSRRILRGHTALARASAWSITGSGVLMSAIVLVRGLVWPSNTAGWGSLLALVGISTVEPLLTVLLAVVVRSETLVALQILCGVLILLSVIVLQTQRLPLRHPVTEPAAGD